MTTMKKFLAIVIGLSLAYGGYVLVSKKPKRVTGPTTTVAEPLAIPQPRLRAMFQGPRVAETPEKPNRYSKECLSLWGGLRQIDLSEWAKWPQDKREPPLGGECKRVPPFLTFVDENYRKQCTPKGDPNTCLTAIFFYRAALTNWMTQKRPIDQERDVRILIDKLFARFLSNPASAVEVAERLRELEPNLYPATKAALMARVLRATDEKWKSNDPRFGQIEDLLSRADRMSPQDSGQLFETRMLLEKSKASDPNFTSMENLADERSRQHPESGIGPYYLAWVAHKKGDNARALEWLAEARSREPKNSRYSDTTTKLNSKTADPFQVILSFNLDLEKYLNP